MFINELFGFIVNKFQTRCAAVKNAIYWNGPSLHNELKKPELDIENILC